MKKHWGKCILLAIGGALIALFAFILGKKSR